MNWAAIVRNDQEVDSQIYIINEITKILDACIGGVAQMVERALRMREVKGSMPFSSTFFIKKTANIITLPEETNTGPGFNRGPGAAPGGVASKNGRGTCAYREDKKIK